MWLKPNASLTSAKYRVNESRQQNQLHTKLELKLYEIHCRMQKRVFIRLRSYEYIECTDGRGESTSKLS